MKLKDLFENAPCGTVSATSIAGTRGAVFDKPIQNTKPQTQILKMSRKKLGISKLLLKTI